MSAASARMFDEFIKQRPADPTASMLWRDGEQKKLGLVFHHPQ